MEAFVEIRGQHSRGSSANKFGGPDTYVTVQVVPEGKDPLRCLNRKAAAKRGIRLFYCGEGYSKHRGPKSMLGKAIFDAEEIADCINTLDQHGINEI